MVDVNKKTLWIWGNDGVEHGTEQERNLASTGTVSVLQLEEVAIDKFAMGKSCGALISQNKKCYQVGRPGEADLSLSEIESSLCEVSLLSPHFVTEVSCGYHHVAVVTNLCAVFCWGVSNHGQCGVIADAVWNPVLVELGRNGENLQFKSIACGKSHTMAISNNDELWGWGLSHLIGGNSATKQNIPKPKPELVEHLCGRKVLQVGCGKYHTVALTEKAVKNKTSQSDSSTICSICKQETYRMYDNDDQVIISDTHICSVRNDGNPIFKKASQTHNRSASLPFLKRPSPLLARRERLSRTPPTLPRLSLVTSSEKINEANDKNKKIQLELKTRNSFSEDSIQGKSDSDDAKSVNSIEKHGLLDVQPMISMSKSTSTPADLCKEQYNGQVPHFPCKLLTDDSSSYSNSPSGSKSPSLASVDECKARMTLALSTDLNVDTESAMAYLQQLSPDANVRSMNLSRPITEKIDENSELLSSDSAQSSTEKGTSLSERISISLAENQLLSPITAYSKNVFTGVMDRIEWIKTSTYDKGVAPIRDFLSKDKGPPKEGNIEDVNGFHDDPLRSTTPVASQEMLPNDDGDVAITLHTEVWTWGNNENGELGLSDQLDRFQPSCVNALSNRGIVKVSCGTHHTIALTSNSEVYSWGCNDYGQLGHDSTIARSPTKIECKHRVWDITAGSHHTLFLVDDTAQEATILVCGTDSSNGTQTAHPLNNIEKEKSKKWKLRPLDFSHKMGFHFKVTCGFSHLSSCISENSLENVTTSLHNFAKAEREFYQQITLIKTEILHPLKFSDLYSCMDGSTYGNVLSQVLENFGRLAYDIGLNTVRLNRVITNGAKCEETIFKYVRDSLIRSYQKYFKLLNNMIAYGFFEFCEDLTTKHSKFLVKPKMSQIFKKLLGEKRISKLPSENFLQALQLPAFRLREYSTFMNKLATTVEENIPMATFLHDLSTKWDGVWNDINNNLRAANGTRGFWKTEFKSSKLSKVAESLKKLGRCLILHSKKVPLDIANSGRFSSNWFILFNDCLVLIQNSTHVIYPLETLWCTSVTDSDGKSHHISISAPEEEFILSAPTNDSKSKWITSLNRAINEKITKSEMPRSPAKDAKQHHRLPPAHRHATYTFTKDSDLKGGVYTGGWLNGKPHGKGEMTWQDGRSYKGSFKNGKEDGYGEWKAAPGDNTKLKYQGWWKDGHMNGYGKLWYNKNRSYEGSFASGFREGHGVLRTGSVTEGSVYVGAWKNDQKNGFGVEDDITKGEKYLGMWVGDERHGVGILVTLDGLYGQSGFTHGSMSGDALLIEGHYVFEGHVSQGLTLNGKGRLTLPTGDKLEGSFSGTWSDHIRISGNFLRLEQNNSNRPESPKTPIDVAPSFTHLPHKDHTRSILRRYNRHIMKKQHLTKGVKAFPLALHPDSKWAKVFSKCRATLKCPSEDAEQRDIDTRKIWEAVSVSISNAKQMREESKQSNFSLHRKCDENKLSWLEKVPSIVSDEERKLSSKDIQCIKDYLVQAFSTTLHPLGELVESLGNVFRDSYSGAGAHKWLLSQAVGDVRSFVRRTYDIIRCLFPHLDKDDDASHMKILHNNNDSTDQDVSAQNNEMVTAGDLLLPVLLPKVYPTLFTLYALRHEVEDRSYWERVTRLNRHPDIALLSFLGVKPKFWLLDEKEIPPLEMSPESGQLYESIEQAESSKWRHLLVARAKDCSFLSAVETLQLISTTFIPAEKLNVIQNTFKEINASVLKHHKQSHPWSMDDLFPVFQYVVIRARISHLGCEIQLIEDFLEPDLCKGEKGIMFTTLKACYFQIRVEKYL